jgi:hypothetical protein
MKYSLIESIPELCYPISITADIEQIQQDIDLLLSKFDKSREEIYKKCETDIGWAMNLTHLPSLLGTDRPFKHTQQHEFLKSRNILENEFTELLDEVKDLYLGKLIQQIIERHNGEFRGRCQLVWLASNKSYGLHKDGHTPNRYHLPIVTDKKCYWHLKHQGKDYNLHMPADGRVWYFNPVALEHNFFNDSAGPRLHMILTSGV